ncbi:MAG: YraN family protein [Oscillospiraceae bacterium]|nr:YraN family protein [Oscillospiraceae bacterium]
MIKSNINGAWGEKLAATYLRKKRYKLVTQNFKGRFGEIDLIVSNKEFLVFVEVKLRKSADFGRAAEFVDFRKQNRIRSTAEIYLAMHPTELQPRFDVIEIYAPDGVDTKHPEINHLEDAF